MSFPRSRRRDGKRSPMMDNEWIEPTTFGHGSYGHHCVLCRGDDYTGRLLHSEGCPAWAYPTREALFEAVNEEEQATHG